MTTTTFDFRDLATGMAVDDPMDGTYSVMELMREHRDRFVMSTSAGAIILRRMPLRMRRTIDSVRTLLYPRTAELRAEAQALMPYFQGVDPSEWDADALARIKEIEAELRVTDMDALGVIEAPLLATMDDYDDLLGRLTEDERQTLAVAVHALSEVTPPSHVDSTAQEVAERYGMTVMTKDMLDMMTVSQAAYLMSRIEKENRAVERMRGGRRWDSRSSGTSRACGTSPSPASHPD